MTAAPQHISIDHLRAVTNETTVGLPDRVVEVGGVDVLAAMSVGGLSPQAETTEGNGTIAAPPAW
ncbi:hypothetical protein DEJ17_15155 [Curtobacterium sp. MCSS17_011]|uniref:hypothetical protein n=1 Tax=Curtobacterium sp. MCSS17_011 TaxID=2175643 RepID=UPI000D847398|nr:hypothetical protein [Curtobacterium sp. MCSS17_011]PYY53453.1 hypothetical protein DEJ17_15155 [Curtobacterium sp. MCSS17_011]